ncbi:MAG: hypothetical protein ACD_64C00296G0003 [uncultured bacterium]|nr:MAG: hypothetical protein ACD_64C00296G0003 [uncultured bacterium]
MKKTMFLLLSIVSGFACAMDEKSFDDVDALLRKLYPNGLLHQRIPRTPFSSQNADRDAANGSAAGSQNSLANEQDVPTSDDEGCIFDLELKDAMPLGYEAKLE